MVGHASHCTINPGPIKYKPKPNPNPKPKPNKEIEQRGNEIREGKKKRKEKHEASACSRIPALSDFHTYTDTRTLACTQ